MKRRLNISIVTYHTDINELKRCLQSLDSPVVGDIYIIDNSNQRYIAEYCQSIEKVTYIANENLGYGAAHNIGIRLSMNQGSDYHLVLNSDVRFKSEVLETLIDVMDKHTNIGQIQPKITYPNGELQHTVRMLPTPKDLLFRRFLPQWLIEKNDHRYLLKFADHNKEMNIPYHQGSFMLFRTSALQQIGLFDERFFMYPEDIDITRRMHRNYPTIYYPHVSIIHDHRAASYKSNRMLRIHIVNMIRYFNKWGWLFDRERRKFNRQIIDKYYPR